MGLRGWKMSSAALLVLLLRPAHLSTGRHGTVVADLSVRPRENDEKRLMDFLSGGYDRDVRPVINASQPVVIKLGITLTQIFDMDEKNQVLTTNVWLDQEWVDELLTWDPSQFGGLRELRVPCSRLWLPDIVLYNNADDYTRGYMQSKAMVHSDGTVFWPPPTKFRSTCAVDVTYFPFDDQTCILKLGSWTYNGFQVDVTNRTQQVDLSNYVPNGEWELLEARINRNVVYYSCCPEPFPDVTITLIIRRKTLFYMYNIVLPCMMMSVLTLLVFCMPPESGEKISLGVTVLLAFSVFMLAIAEKMPETSDSVPLIGIYLTAVMAITSVSIIMTVFVLNIHYRGPAKRTSKWIRQLAALSSGQASRRPRNSGYHTQCRRRRRGLDSGRERQALSESSPIVHGGISKTSVMLEPSAPPDADSAELTAEYGGHQRLTTANGGCAGLSDEPGWPLHTSGRQEDTAQRDQWRRTAIRADRVLFWFFLVVTTLSSLLFLVVLPVYKRSQYQRPV